MKYGSVKIDHAIGAVLAHSFKPAMGRAIKKGTVLDADAVARMKQSGAKSVLVAELESHDLSEDEAARRIGEALATHNVRAEPASTGRVNLYAQATGLFRANRSVIDKMNRLNPGITVATLDELVEVNDGRMIATVKIIPYAVPESSVAEAIALADPPPIAIEPYAPRKVGVVSTTLPHLKSSVMDKTLRVLRQRLSVSGSRVVREIRVEHDPASVAAAVGELLPNCDIVLVFGASAICDIDDVIPSAIRSVGGRIEHFGMPVDPGNLLLIGWVDDKPVIGAPGCARSPAENGFDWILRRLVAGVGITSQEITGMGVGGLLMEIGMRPQPREGTSRPIAQTAAIVLAAGQSRRMGATNKLTASINGVSMISRVVEAALGSRADPVIVVTGYEREEIESEIAGQNVTLVHNSNYEDGLSASLAAGIGALPDACDSAVILLGDMPMIESDMIDRLLEEGNKAEPDAIILSTFNGKRGNPVVWPRSYFARLRSISGDVGARHVIGENAERVVTVELGEAAGFDIDTPQAMEDAAGRL